MAIKVRIADVIGDDLASAAVRFEAIDDTDDTVVAATTIHGTDPEAIRIRAAAWVESLNPRKLRWVAAFKARVGQEIDLSKQL